MKLCVFLSAFAVVVSSNGCSGLASSQRSQRRQLTPSAPSDGDGETWDDDSRRSVLSKSTAAALLAVSVSSAIPASPARAFLWDPPTIDQQVQALETANYVGQPFKKIYEPNTSGDPVKHLPMAKVSDKRLVTVQANHVMTPEHFIQFMWLKDVRKDEVVFVKGFPSSEPSPPTMQVTCPSGVTLRPYLFCNLHGLWKGDEFTVA